MPGGRRRLRNQNSNSWKVPRSVVGNKMGSIDKILNVQVGSVYKRAYVILSLLGFLFSLAKPPDLILMVFSSAPSSAFVDNPHASNVQTIVTEWNLTDSRNWIPGFLQSMFYVGYMPGAIIMGQLSDLYGRKRVSWIVYALSLVFQIVTGFCQNWQQFAACRAISGFLIGGLGVVQTILTQESTGSKLWVVNGALAEIGYTANMLAFLWIAYLFPSWRQMYFITTIPGIFVFIYFYIVPESPRWLLSRGKIISAQEVVEKISKWNKSNEEDYDLLLDDDAGTISSDRQTGDTGQSNSREISTARLLTSEPEIKKTRSIIDLIKHPTLRYRSLILSLQWFTASFVFYGITLGSGSFSSNFYVAFIISGISQIPAVPLFIYLMERKWAGRRRTLIWFMALGAICMFVMYIVPFEEGEHSNYKLALLFFGKIGISGAFDLLYIYTAELFPTVVRNVGLGSMSFWARVGGVIAPFLANLAMFSGLNTPFLAFGVVSFASSVFAAFLPETRGKIIPNTIEEAEQQEDETDEDYNFSLCRNTNKHL
ncbi:solute carrier family 22 member 15-like [Styela clava]